MFDFPFQQTHYEDIVKHNFEGESFWPYLDTHEPNALITIGIGCATSLGEMLKLPFKVNGVLASQGVILDHYNRVMKMKPGMWYTKYQYKGCLMLPEDSVQSLIKQRYSVFTGQLVGVFPNFMSFPEPLQEACLDLIWGLGLGHGGLKPNGLHAYTEFMAAANKKPIDFLACSQHCVEDAGQKPYVDRNSWRQALVIQASKMVK